MNASLPAPIVPAVRVARPPIPDDQKLVFSGIDFLIEAVADRLTPALQEQITAEFGAYLRKSRYPVLVGNRLIDLLCATCLADRPRAAARQLFGRYYVTRYQETITGGLLRLMVPRVSLAWVVRGLPRNFAAATNYGTYWVAELEPHHWRLDFEDDPGYPDRSDDGSGGDPAC